MGSYAGLIVLEVVGLGSVLVVAALFGILVASLVAACAAIALTVAVGRPR